MSDATEVKALVKALNTASGSGANEEVLVILRRLQKEVNATEELLKETRVGVAVSKLRIHAVQEVSDLSKAIVKKWKGSVKGTKSSTPTTAKKEKAESSPTTAKATPSASRAGSGSQPATPAQSRNSSISGPASKAPAIRTCKTDGVKADSTGDKVRDKCLEMVYDALASDSNAPTEQILSRAKAVENTVYKEFGDINSNYKNKMRRLFLNLKDKANPALRTSVVSGDLAVHTFCNMSVQEMASEDRKLADKQLQDANLFKSLGAGEQEAETDAFQCGRCKERKTRYRQAQTRSADEPMTTFVTCTNCGNRWKFS